MLVMLEKALSQATGRTFLMSSFNLKIASVGRQLAFAACTANAQSTLQSESTSNLRCSLRRLRCPTAGNFVLS